MIVREDGYSITQDVSHNRVVICLPQTLQTATNTVTPMKDRKIELSEKEEAWLLNYAVTLFEKTDVHVSVDI